MKISIAKIIIFVLALSLAFPMTHVAASAVKDEMLFEASDSYVKWSMSDDGNTVTGDGKTYTYYEAPIRSVIVANKGYTYGNLLINIYNGYPTSVNSYEKQGEIIWLDGADYLYVTDEGRAHLDRFYRGVESGYKLFVEGRETQVDGSFVSELSRYHGTRQSFNLPSLVRYEEFVIDECDSKNIVGYPIASVFSIDGGFYYVDYKTLDSSYFNSDGYISFRKGSIELVKLDEALTAKLRGYIRETEYQSREWEFEYGSEETHHYDYDLEYIWSMFVCPVGGIAAGIILPRSRKLGKPRRWYAVAVLSGVMLILSIILLII